MLAQSKDRGIPIGIPALEIVQQIGAHEFRRAFAGQRRWGSHRRVLRIQPLLKRAMEGDGSHRNNNLPAPDGQNLFRHVDIRQK
jgi:hypothetical protein